MDALDNRTLKPLCSLTVRDSILRLKHSGIPEWQGFEALYLWFIQKTLAGRPVRRPSRVLPCLANGVEKWVVEDETTGDLSAVASPSASKYIIKLHSQRGIHKPACVDFAATLIYGSGPKYEKQESMVQLDDGTSVILYKRQEKSSSSNKTNKRVYNDALLACMASRLPVGVFNKVSSGLYLPSLYFVTDFDETSGIATLQGPITSLDDARFGTAEDAAIANTLKGTSTEEYVDPTTRERISVVVAKRTRQQSFRDQLLHAYNNSCAVTSYDVPVGLEAAHIWRHFGRASQTTPHGILLRADIHRLYDAQLCSIEPGTHRFLLAESIRDSRYRKYDGQVIHLPQSDDLWPNERDLEVQQSKFLLANSA